MGFYHLKYDDLYQNIDKKLYALFLGLGLTYPVASLGP